METTTTSAVTTPPSLAPTSGGRVFEFSPFRLDLVSGQLLRGEEPIALRPKTWSVLRYLVERRGSLVTRDELLDAVWRDAVVCDDNLTQSIAEIRRALGEDPREPRFLETVRGRGFRFHGAPADRPGVVQAPTPPRARRDFVGREAELTRLSGLAAAAATGTRRLVFVTGEPGTGKTSLVDAFLDRLVESDELWIARGQAVEHYGACEPYLPVLDALQRLAREPRAASLVDVVRRVAPSWASEIEPRADGAPPAKFELTPARMLREMANALEELSRVRTLVLVFEDLHWSDPSTVDLLGLLARRRDPARLLILGTYRPAEAAVKDHPVAMLRAALEARGDCVPLPLEDLGRDEVTAFLRRRYGERADLERLGRWLHRRSEGNPLFMVALAEQRIAPCLVTGGAIDEAMLDDAEIPQDLVALIETQLVPLDPGLRRILDAAAIAGPTFDAQPVAAALGLGLAETEEACARLVHTHGLLVEAAVQEWPDGSVAGRYGFRHAMYHQFLAARIAPARARAMHRAVAERLEAAWGDRAAEIAADLAHHFDRAGERLSAIRSYTDAGLRALGRGAFREARGCFEAGLEHLRHVPESAERDRRELEILLPLAGIFAGESFYCAPQLAPTLERAMLLADRLGDRARFFGACYAHWYDLAVRGERDGARAAVATLERLAAESGGVARLVADNAACETLVWTGDDLETAREIAERVLAADGTDAAAELERTPPFGIDPIVGAGVHLGYALWLLGFPDRALEVESRVISRAERLGRAFTLTQALGQQSVLHLGCGRPEAALRFSERAHAAAVEYGLEAWARVAEVDRAAARVRSTRDARDLVSLRRAIDAYLATGSFICSPFYAALAEACLDLRELETGLSVVREGQARIAGSFDQLFSPELHRLEGEILVAGAPSGRKGAGVRAEAAHCFDAAITRARAQKSRIFELRALTGRVRLERPGSAREALRSELSSLYGGFREGLDLADLRLAKRVLGSTS